jgi:S1-C subfamily serine protease
MPHATSTKTACSSATFPSLLQKSRQSSFLLSSFDSSSSSLSSEDDDDDIRKKKIQSNKQEDKNSQTEKKQQQQQQQQQVVITTDSPIVTPSSFLDQNLTNDERSIVNIVRTRSPSVACVSCYSIPTSTNAFNARQRFNSRSSSSRRRNDQNKSKTNDSTTTSKTKEPPVGSISLGSGSAFAISSDGYLITNYHVIERAYQMQQTSIRLEEFQNNITRAMESYLPGFFLSSPPARLLLTLPRRAQVYASLKSSSEVNIPCRIVHVLPERDIAILHLNATSMVQQGNIPYPPPIPNGLSTDLLVGQTVLAIGNPFGLSQTVTTGVVSSLDRTVRGVAGNDIRGCIQTDAAINPGNSGGPLLNSMGQVVGVNTMIVSTSGSNAGIGFAVPLDGIWSEVMDVVEEDREMWCRSGGVGMDLGGDGGKSKKRRGWLGLKVVTDEKLQDALLRRIKVENDASWRQGQGENGSGGVFVLEVEIGSPALDAGIRPLQMKEGKVEIGDRIVAVNGNLIVTPHDLKKEIQYRIVGEKVTITVENANGERRVVYTTLVEKP